MPGVITKFAPQAGHAQIDGSVQPIMGKAPDLQLNPVTSEDDADVSGQQEKEVEFGIGEVDGLGGQGCAPALEINPQIADLEFRSEDRGLAGPGTGESNKLGHEMLVTEGMDQNHVSSQFEGPDLFTLLGRFKEDAKATVRMVVAEFTAPDQAAGRGLREVHENHFMGGGADLVWPTTETVHGANLTVQADQGGVKLVRGRGTVGKKQDGQRGHRWAPGMEVRWSESQRTGRAILSVIWLKV